MYRGHVLANSERRAGEETNKKMCSIKTIWLDLNVFDGS